MIVTLKPSSTHGMFHANIIIVTTDDDRTSKLLAYQKFKLAKKSVDGLAFIESKQKRGMIVTQTKWEEVKNHPVRVAEAMKKELLHNKTNGLGTPKPKSMTTLSKPSPSILHFFERDDQIAETQNVKVKNLRYNATDAITNTEATDSHEALVFPSESSTLKGLKFLLSGKFPKYDSGQPSSSPNDELHIGKDTITGAIKDNGGRCLTRLSNSVDFLVVGAEPGYTKFMNAITKRIRVISVNDLHQLATDEITVEALRLKEDVKVKKFSVMSAVTKKVNKGTKRKNDSKELEVRAKTRKSKKVANGTADVAAAVGEERITLPPGIPHAVTEERLVAESVLCYGIGSEQKETKTCNLPQVRLVGEFCAKNDTIKQRKNKKAAEVERKQCSSEGCKKVAEKGGRCDNCFSSLWGDNCFSSLWKGLESNVTDNIGKEDNYLQCKSEGCTKVAEKGGRCDNCFSSLWGDNCFSSLWKGLESNITD